MVQQQAALNSQGATVGSVVVRLTELVTGEPLVTYAGDVMWGQNFEWESPLVRPYVDGPADDPTADPLASAQHAAAGTGLVPDG